MFASRLALATSGLDFEDDVDVPVRSSPTSPPSEHSDLAARLLSAAIPRGHASALGRQQQRQHQQDSLSHAKALLHQSPRYLGAEQMSELYGGDRAPLHHESASIHLPTPRSGGLLPTPEASPVKCVPALATSALPLHSPYTGAQGRALSSPASEIRSETGDLTRRDSGGDGGRRKELAAVAWMMECLQSMAIVHERYQRQVVAKVNHVSGKLARLEETVSRLRPAPASSISEPALAHKPAPAETALQPPPGPCVAHQRGHGDVVMPPPRQQSAAFSPGRALTAGRAPSLKPPPKSLVAPKIRRPAGKVKSYVVEVPAGGLCNQKVAYRNVTGLDAVYTLTVRGREGMQGSAAPSVKLASSQLSLPAAGTHVIAMQFGMEEGAEGGVVTLGVRNEAEGGREDVLRFTLKRSL